MTRPGNSDFRIPSSIPDGLLSSLDRWMERLVAEDARATEQLASMAADDRDSLLRLVASSEFAATVISRQWPWFLDARLDGQFDLPVNATTLAGFVERLASVDEEALFRCQLRQSRDQYLVHILWRSIVAEDETWETLAALSSLADALIAASMVFAERSLQSRFGTARNSGGEVTYLLVLAMGKLGGAELNFSSDIDLIFLYPEDGETDGPRSVSVHEYFTRLCRLIVSLLDDVTENGFVYRVDTRLRPFGESGPPVVSFAALENYLVQHGRGWERYAYVKARPISPGGDAAEIQRLVETVIEPFVYRRYLDYGVFESLREMKALIANEVKQRALQNNVKLGPGGIREIEFIVQSLQLVRGGANEKLRRRDLRGALHRLGRSRGLGRAAVLILSEAYYFLRKLENGIQAIRDQQTHDLPDSQADRARLQIVMGYETWDGLVSDLDRHRKNVSDQFSEVAFRGGDDRVVESSLATSLAALWNGSAVAGEWQQLLQDNGFEEAESIAATLVHFRSASLPKQIDATASKRLAQFMRAFLLLLQDRRNPGAVCGRVLEIVAQIARRSAYIALLNENPAVLERLTALCEHSGYLAAEIARFPLLLDELLDPRLYSATISPDSMRTDLEERLAPLDDSDSERRIEALAQFQRATLFRIAVADISGNLPIMKVSDRLTDLAEIVLGEALRIAQDDLVARHGRPVCHDADGMREAGMGVVAFGKLGGMELSYRSDLDLVFLHDSQGSREETDGAKPLDNSVFFSRLVRRLVHFLTAQTPSGALYEVDTRLRPSGRSGLLVVNIDAFEKYEEDNAWTWEHQALLRSRPVAGSAVVAREFERIRADTLRNRVRRDCLLEDVLSMRAKMREQLDKSDSAKFDLKQGEGGIGDIEFLVQYLVLKHAAGEPALIHYSDNIRQLGTLEAAGVLSPGDVAQLQDAYKAYRLATHRLALDDKPPLVSNGEFLQERDFVIEVWQREMREQAVR